MTKHEKIPNRHAVTTKINRGDLEALESMAKEAKTTRGAYIRTVLRQHLLTVVRAESSAS